MLVVAILETCAVAQPAAPAVDPAQAAAPSAENQNPLFAFPNTWIGGEPPSLEALRGKAVLFYFFEETCSRCKANWPAMMEVAHEHADDPIAFVAVNSGTPMPAAASYARTVHLDWPVIVDVDRSFETACGVGPISLQNIVQVRYLSPTGELKKGNWSDMEGTIAAALEGAAWKLDPAEIPDELRLAWRSIEFARYGQAATGVQQGLSSRKREVKAAAKKLADVVAEAAGSELEAAAAAAADSKYRAHALYDAIAAKYEGFPAATKAAGAARELSKDPELKKELVAIRLVERQGVLLNSRKPSARDRAAAAIQKLIDEQPMSEAARIGREMLRAK